MCGRKKKDRERWEIENERPVAARIFVVHKRDVVSKSITSHAKRDFLINVFVCKKKYVYKKNWMQQNDTVALFHTYYNSQMLAFFCTNSSTLKLEVNRILRSKRLEKRVFYLSSSFSLLLDFLVSILLFAMTPNSIKISTQLKVIVTRGAIHCT